jgi:3-isopropylmalate/(R)-2-methylmalate dehydratase small subunit
MAELIKGRALKYGDNINTDIISPPQYMELSIAEASRYAMTTIDPAFPERMKDGGIIVAGANFGSGSSRETAPLTLKYLGAGAVVAKFFARIFYRNAINIGLPVIECAEADEICDGDALELDFEAGRIQNLTSGKTYACSRIPEHIMAIITDGGLIEHIRKSMKEGAE